MREGDPDRPRFIEPAAPAGTPEEAARRRAMAMTSIGVIALLIGIAAYSGGAAVGLLVGILGVALLVGGLVIRR